MMATTGNWRRCVVKTVGQQCAVSRPLKSALLGSEGGHNRLPLPSQRTPCNFNGRSHSGVKLLLRSHHSRRYYELLAGGIGRESAAEAYLVCAVGSHSDCSHNSVDP